MVFDKLQAVEGIRSSRQEGSARSGAMGDGGMKGERSGTRGEADWARRDENEVVVGIKIHGGRGMFREERRGSQYQWFATQSTQQSSARPSSLSLGRLGLRPLLCLPLFDLPGPGLDREITALTASIGSVRKFQWELILILSA